jgi:CheY-like chemotaxis protein
MRILLATHNVELALLRAKVLESEGHDVEIGMSDQQLMALIASRNYDLLLVCHSLPEDICQEIAHAYRMMNPEGHVAGTLRHDWDDSACGTQKFDAQVSGISGPGALVNMVRHVGRQSASSA